MSFGVRIRFIPSDRYVQSNGYTASAKPVSMGACPYCRSTTLPSDTICYSCGRVLPKGDRKSYRLEQQFSKGSKSKTHKMASKPSQRGVVQTHTGRKTNIMRRRKNRFRSFAMLGLTAFILLSPQAQEHLLGEFGSFDEILQSATAQYHIYPVEASYTLSKTASVDNTGVAGYLVENIMIPPTLQSNLPGVTTFSYTDDTDAIEPTTLQQTLQISLVVDGQSINIPLDGLPSREHNDRITTSDGHEVWWPGVGNGDNDCPIAACVKVKVNLDAGESVAYSFNIQVQSVSYSWWDSNRVDARIDGKSTGINMDNSGTFEDLNDRGNGLRAAQFGDELWYNRGTSFSPYWAINGQDAVTVSTAETIASSLPEGESENAYGFARASFDFLHANVVYDREAPVTSRSGPECIAGGLGDCDDQTNAFFSLLRTRGVPGWYAFGILGDPYFSDDGWEAHAWGYIQLPLSSDWCEERNIALSSCFVEPQVDVVNNKWLLSTPTAYIDWVETTTSNNDNVYDYYHPVRTEHLSAGGNMDRERSYSTLGDIDLSGGSYQVKIYPESLG